MTIQEMIDQRNKLEMELKNIENTIEEYSKKEVTMDLKTFCDVINAIESGVATQELKDKLYSIGKQYEYNEAKNEAKKETAASDSIPNSLKDRKKSNIEFANPKEKEAYDKLSQTSKDILDAISGIKFYI